MTDKEIIHLGQEPVAVISESAIGLVKLHSNGACLPFGTQLYAAPVSAEPCKECDAKQAKIDSLMLEYCPDEITDEQMTEWSANQKPVSECRHCGWLCMPNDSHSKKWYPMQEPVNQEPVAIVDEIGLCLDGRPIFNAVGKVKVGQKLYAAPVRTKDLTDAEIHKLVKQVRFDGMTDKTFQFARAVIAADRELNNANNNS